MVLTEKFSDLGYSGNIIHNSSFTLFEWCRKDGMEQAPICGLFKLFSNN